jgi:hypothetical protein
VKTKMIKGAAGFIAAMALLSGAFFLAGAVSPVQGQDPENSNNMNSMQGNRGHKKRGKGNSNGNMNDNGNSNNTNNSNLR